MKNKVSVLGIGVATMDMYIDRGRMYPGGNEYNVACNASFLGARAGFLGVFGNDLAGKLLEDTLKNVDVDVQYCHHEEGSSGYSLVRLKEDGDRVFLDWNKQGVTDLYPISFTKEEVDYVKSFDVATLGRCASVSLERIQYLANNGIDLVYDFHAIYTDQEIMRIAPYAKYAFFSASHLEIPELKRTLKLAVDHGCRIAVGTRGCDSIFAYDGEEYYEQNTYPEDVVDALGAGDSFISSFMVYYLKFAKSEAGMTRADCIRKALDEAARYAATVVLKEGSIGVGYDMDPDKISDIVNI